MLLTNLWMIPWYLMPIKDQKCYRLMLFKAQHAKDFTIPFIDKMNMETFTNVRYSNLSMHAQVVLLESLQVLHKIYSFIMLGLKLL